MTFSGAQILLVDDSESEIELIIDAFRDLGTGNKIDVVRSATEALDYLYKRMIPIAQDSRALPDLILLALKMSSIDGIDLLRRMKSTKGLKRIPMIALTSSAMDEDSTSLYDTGMNSFLAKPVSLAGFIELARNLENYWLKLNIGPPKDLA